VNDDATIQKTTLPPGARAWHRVLRKGRFTSNHTIGSAPGQRGLRPLPRPGPRTMGIPAGRRDKTVRSLALLLVAWQGQLRRTGGSLVGCCEILYAPTFLLGPRLLHLRFVTLLPTASGETTCARHSTRKPSSWPPAARLAQLHHRLRYTHRSCRPTMPSRPSPARSADADPGGASRRHHRPDALAAHRRLMPSPLGKKRTKKIKKSPPPPPPPV